MQLSWNLRYLGVVWCLLMTALVVNLPQAKADTANLVINLTIITPPECTFNGNSSISVNFNEVRQELIDGDSYKRMPINNGLTCSNLHNNSLKMTLSWSNVVIDGFDAVSTNLSNFGLAIYQNNTRLNNNKVINFANNNPPELYAVPVKPNGMALTDGGSFSGTLNMLIEYE